MVQIGGNIKHDVKHNTRDANVKNEQRILKKSREGKNQGQEGRNNFTKGNTCSNKEKRIYKGRRSSVHKKKDMPNKEEELRRE